jgi:hypothetical protein
MTLTQAREANLYQLYTWCDPTEQITVGAGKRCTVLAWLETEQRRISQDKTRVAAIVHQGTRVTLFVNLVAGGNSDLLETALEDLAHA